METKTCGVCKNEFPKTLEYFYKKTTKQKKANGEIAVYESLRHQCKQCNNNEEAKRKRDKYNEDKELGRKLSNEKRLKNPERHRQYVRNWRLNNIDLVRQKDRERVNNLDDSWVCSQLKIKKSECPKEILETKKLTLLIHRELKNYGK